MMGIPFQTLISNVAVNSNALVDKHQLISETSQTTEYQAVMAARVHRVSLHLTDALKERSYLKGQPIAWVGLTLLPKK